MLISDLAFHVAYVVAGINIGRNVISRWHTDIGDSYILGRHVLLLLFAAAHLDIDLPLP